MTTLARHIAIKKDTPREDPKNFESVLPLWYELHLLYLEQFGDTDTVHCSELTIDSSLSSSTNAPT